MTTKTNYQLGVPRPIAESFQALADIMERSGHDLMIEVLEDYLIRQFSPQNLLMQGDAERRQRLKADPRSAGALELKRQREEAIQLEQEREAALESRLDEMLLEEMVGVLLRERRALEKLEEI